MRHIAPSCLCLALTLMGCGSSIVLEDAGADGGTASGVDVDVTGTWHLCDATVTYRRDGSAGWVDHRRDCAREGTWTVAGDRLDTVWDAGPCGEARRQAQRAVVVPQGLVLIDPITGTVSRLANDGTPSTRWTLEGAEGSMPRSSIASVVGDPESSFGSGCYWSTDGDCGGHFSCSGQIRVWELRGEQFSASTSCSGDCPCGAVIRGSIGADGVIDATYRGVNCDRSYEGLLTAVPVE